MNSLQFQYHDYDVEAIYQYDVREDATYVGNIDFTVFNSQGEDVTCDLPSIQLVDIHQEILRQARINRDLEIGAGHDK